MSLEKAIDLKFSTLFHELSSEHPEILSERIESAVQFKVVAAKMNLKKEEILNNFGVTPGRFHLLTILKVEPSKTLSPSELSKRIHVTRATITQFVNALEKEEYVERILDSKDRRGMLVKLTQKGSSKLNEIMPDYLELLNDFTSPLSQEEHVQFHHLMRKIHSGFVKK